MYNPNVFYCPGCKSACKEGELTCSIGAKFYKEFKKRKEELAAMQSGNNEEKEEK